MLTKEMLTNIYWTMAWVAVIIVIFCIVMGRIAYRRKKERQTGGTPKNTETPTPKKSSPVAIWVLSIVCLILLILSVKLWGTGHREFPTPSTAVAKKEVAYSHLKPVGQFVGEKRFEIVAPPGNFQNPETWSEEVVIPYGCSYNLLPNAPVVYWCENYQPGLDGPTSLGYNVRYDPSLHHFWFVAQGDKPVVVKVEILSPGRH